MLCISSLIFYFTEILKSIEESLMSIGELKSFIKLFSEYSDWFEKFTLNNYVDEFKIFMEQ